MRLQHVAGCTLLICAMLINVLYLIFPSISSSVLKRLIISAGHHDVFFLPVLEMFDGAKMRMDSSTTTRVSSSSFLDRVKCSLLISFINILNFSFIYIFFSFFFFFFFFFFKKIFFFLIFPKKKKTKMPFRGHWEISNPQVATYENDHVLKLSIRSP